jgi:rhodanese-related sulfurtransferase
MSFAYCMGKEALKKPCKSQKIMAKLEKEDTMKHALHMGLLSWSFAVILFPQAALTDSELTDAQKKEIVYQMYADYKKDFPGVKDISPLEAMKLMKEGRVVFVDTRSPAEMKVSMLPNAVTKDEFLKDPSKYKDQTVVGYCTISYRSGLFAEEMARKGIMIYNLSGGLLAWVLEGGKVYDANGETKRIHVYDEKWNYPPKGYESVMFGFWDKYF